MLYADAAFLEYSVSLALDILFESANAKSANILFGVVMNIRYGCRIKHIHQRCKALTPTIMRRCGKHDKGIRPTCEQFCQPCALRLMSSAFCNIMSLIDYNNIPCRIFKMGAVFYVSFQCIVRDDGFIISELSN